MKKSLLLLSLVIFTCCTRKEDNKYKKDFTYYWQQINDQFAYFDKQKTDWKKAKSIYEPMLDTVNSDNSFIHLLESMNNELYNGHVSLGVNTHSSNRIIPTGADMDIVYRNHKFIISQIRKGFNADECGLAEGMTITMFNGQPIEEAIKPILPKSVTDYDSNMYNYAATMLIAGRHNTPRKITALANGVEKEYYPDKTPNKTEDNDTTLLAATILTGNIGYIQINNSLYNSDLIKAFDTALDRLINTNGLILDLRETPSGGNTSVARAIMGRFIDKEMPYQKHIYVNEEKETGIKRLTLELVAPRGKIYDKPLVVLVGYWTASMGEGISIGFYGMKRAKIIGNKMAGLLGEVYTFEIEDLQIPFNIPTVKLQTIDGLPREDFVPIKPDGDIMEAAKKMLAE